MSEVAPKKAKVTPALKVAALEIDILNLRKELAEARMQNVMWEIKFLEAHAAAAENRIAYLKATHNV